MIFAKEEPGPLSEGTMDGRIIDLDVGEYQLYCSVCGPLDLWCYVSRGDHIDLDHQQNRHDITAGHLIHLGHEIDIVTGLVI